MTPDSMLWFQELIVISQDSFDVQFSKVLTRKKFDSLALSLMDFKEMTSSKLLGNVKL